MLKHDAETHVESSGGDRDCTVVAPAEAIRSFSVLSYNELNSFMTFFSSQHASALCMIRCVVLSFVGRLHKDL